MRDKQLALFTECPALTSTAAYSTFHCSFLSPDKLNLIVIQLISPFSRCYCLPSSRKTALPLSNAARDKKAFHRLSSLHWGLNSQTQRESNQHCKLVKGGVGFKPSWNVWDHRANATRSTPSLGPRLRVGPEAATLSCPVLLRWFPAPFRADAERFRYRFKAVYLTGYEISVFSRHCLKMED